jgi:hypothetical protein
MCVDRTDAGVNDLLSFEWDFDEETGKPIQLVLK